jgi:energy-coupling factor transporter transmembrane protein EcfT
MIATILLAILAVLLFGSSAVIGFLGAVLGFVVAVAALAGAAIVFSLEPVTVVLWAAGILAALMVAGKLADSRYTATLGGKQARSDYEKLLADAEKRIKSRDK